MLKQKTEYNIKTDFSEDIIYQFPDFDFVYIGKETSVWSPGNERIKSFFHVPISTLYFLVSSKQETQNGNNQFLAWSSGTGIVAPYRFEINGKKFVLDLFNGITIWENEKFPTPKYFNIIRDVELKKECPL